MQAPGFWDDPKRGQKHSQTIKRLRDVIKPHKELMAAVTDVSELIELTEMEGEEGQEEEFQKEVETLESRLEAFEVQCTLSSELDAGDCFLNIHPGAGGTESCDWASMLLRMYLRFCERSGFQFDLIDRQEGDEAGIKNATIHIKGEYAYGRMRSENGIHRLVRISPFDSNSRRHTSFASVHASPEIDDSVEIEILDKDLRVDTFRSSGAGGQHVNVTDSAVRITHFPTGIVVTCQNERSQHQNRETAMKVLRARLFEIAMQEQAEKAEQLSGEKKDIAWGNQIRSYVLHPYQMIKDLRTSVERGDVQNVLDGDLDDYIDAYLRWALKNSQK